MNRDTSRRVLERAFLCDPESSPVPFLAMERRLRPPICLRSGKVIELTFEAETEIKFEWSRRSAGALFLVEPCCPSAPLCKRCRAYVRYRRAQARRAHVRPS